MFNESTYKLLLAHAHGEVNEELLSFVANNSNGSSILYMSMERFCEIAGIDECQAMNFFRSFGANSFLAFKNLLRETLYSEATSLGVTDRSISSIADEVIRYEIQNLAIFSQTIDCLNIKRLAKEILSASEVILFSYDHYAPILDNLARMFRVLGIKFNIVTSTNIEDNIDIPAISKSSLILTFGFPRYSKAGLLRLKHLKQHGAHIVSVTDNSDSPLVFLSDYYFTLPICSFDFTDSYSAVMAFVSILSITIGIENKEVTLSRLQNREELIDDMNMFF